MIPDQWWRSLGLPVPVPEYRFHPSRRWRFDFYFPEYRVAIEIEGGVFKRGRHVRPTGFLGDMEKYNAAAEMGILILRYTHVHRIDPDQIRKTFLNRIKNG